jgi:branched-chain amino acid transport system permease protein
MGRGAWLALAVAVAAVAASVLAGSGYFGMLLIWLSINALITASFRFVLLVGELNFAVAGFVGIGAYSAGAATVILGLPFWMALAIGALVAGLASVPFGFVTLRAKGPYFMLISFAFTEVMRLIYTRSDSIGGNSGMVGIFPPDWLTQLYPALVVSSSIAGLLVLHRIERSDFGRVMNAIRDNDDLVQTLGIDVHRRKVLVVAIASALAGLCGALLAHANNVISPGDFGFLLAVFALAYLKVGGEGHIAGAIVGAVVLTLIAQYAMGFGSYEHVFYGSAIVLAVLLMPEGLVGLARRLLARPAGAAHADPAQRGARSH